MEEKKTIAVIGDAVLDRDDKRYVLARALGKALVENGFKVQNGGHAGVMEAVSLGAHEADNYVFGDVIGILPSSNPNDANPYIDIKVPTGMDLARNAKVVAASAVIAIGGGAGTLGEMATAWSMLKLMIAFKGVEGWSDRLADTRLDTRIRYEGIKEDRVFGASSVEEAISLLLKYLPEYNKEYKGIPSYKAEK